LAGAIAGVPHRAIEASMITLSFRQTARTRPIFMIVATSRVLGRLDRRDSPATAGLPTQDPGSGVRCPGRPPVRYTGAALV
jgi:hypothetical protein